MTNEFYQVAAQVLRSRANDASEDGNSSMEYGFLTAAAILQAAQAGDMELLKSYF